MRVFTVHTPPPPEAQAGEPAPLLIREGFCWSALVFGPLWFLAHRLWLPGLAVLALSLAAGLVSGWLALALALLLGFEAQDIRRWALSRKGWGEAGLVAAADAEAATQRLVDAAA